VTHPDDFLADYVDGTLDEPRRADVDAHLLGCARCREEVRLAGAAKVSLADLQDVPVPFGVTGPVVVGAGKDFERRGRAWDRVRWTAGLAAAAALVLVVVLNIEGGDERNAARPAAASAATGAAAEAGGGGAAPAPVPFKGLERQQDVSYDEAGIQAVAVDASEAIVAAEKAQEKAGGSAGGMTQESAALSAPDAATQRFGSAASSKRCIQQSGLPTDSPRDHLIRMIEAKFDGTPAYIAVFAEGPGAGQPADHVVVWVVSSQDCSRILTTASQRISRA
jgi:anti-sigma factor RsiW